MESPSEQEELYSFMLRWTT